MAKTKKPNTEEKISNIKKAEYDPEKKVLRITFSRGDVYEYFDVEVGIYAGLMSAQSKDTFFRTAIKGKYTFSKK